MKKLFLLILAVVVVNTTMAQNLRFGPKVGLNISNISNLENNKSRISPVVGLMGYYKIMPWIGVQGELLYSTQGFHRDAYLTEELDQIRKELVTNNYVTVPVLAKVFVPATNLSFEVGPQFEFLMLSQGIEDGDRDYPVKLDSYRKFTWSMSAGVSYMIMDLVQLNVRYNLGMNDVMKVLYSPDEKGLYKNRVLQFSVSVPIF